MYVGLGTDVGAGTSFSLLATMNEAYKVAELNNYPMNAIKSFYLATLGGAEALDLADKIGSLEVGKEADFVVLDPKSTPLLDYRSSRAESTEELMFVLSIMADGLSRVYQVDPADTFAAVTTALDAGYRNVDTAQMYGNEMEVGEAIAASDVDRGHVFITSKLNNGCHLPDDTRRAFDDTLAALATDHVYLFLIHWPLPGRDDADDLPTWKTLEEFYRDGLARSIGGSNFQPHHLRRLHEECEITPAVDQVEVHPFLTQDEVRNFCAEHQIRIEAWSPIAQGAVLDDPVIREIRGAGRQDAGTDRVAMAHRARGHRRARPGRAAGRDRLLLRRRPHRRTLATVAGLLERVDTPRAVRPVAAGDVSALARRCAAHAHAGHRAGRPVRCRPRGLRSRPPPVVRRPAVHAYLPRSPLRPDDTRRALTGWLRTRSAKETS